MKFLLAFTVCFLSFPCQAEVVGCLPLGTRTAIQNYRNEIDPLVATNIDKWTCKTGSCFFKSLGLKKEIDHTRKLRQIQVEGDGRITSKNKPDDHYYIHLFLEDATSVPGSIIIIDPTYLQYFHPRVHDRLPLVFIGTREEMLDLYTKHAADIRLQAGEFHPDDPVTVVMNIYGFGDFKTRRTIRLQ